MTVPQVRHECGSSLAMRYSCVVWVWPIRRQTKITSSLLDISYGLDHGNINCFIYLSLLLILPLTQRFCYSSMCLNLVEFCKSLSDMWGHTSKKVVAVVSLAFKSTFSLPVIPT